MKKPVVNESLFRIADKSFELAVEIVKLYDELGDNKSKFQSRQMLRYGTQIGAKVVRSGTDFRRTGFIRCFSTALRRANETQYWLNSVSDSGYISIDVYTNIHGQLEQLCLMMNVFYKKIVVNKAIIGFRKSRVCDRQLLHYYYN